MDACLFYARRLGERKEATTKRPLAYITAPWGENEYLMF